MLTQGQRYDFLAYLGSGTLTLAALGAIPVATAATVVAACGIGAVANQTSSAKSVTTQDQQIEAQLVADYGIDAVMTYRFNRAKGISCQLSARSSIYEALQKR